MLYDILPPLVFFASFAGVIIIVSRAVLRIRRENLSTIMRAQHSAITNVSVEQVFRGHARRDGGPARGGIQLLRTRAGLLAQKVKEAGTSATKLLKKLQQEKTPPEAPKSVAEPKNKISIPTSNWHSRFEGLGQRIMHSVTSVPSALKNPFKKTSPTPAEDSATLPARQEAAAPTPKAAAKKTTQVKIFRVEQRPQPAEQTQAAPPAINNTVQKPEKVAPAADKTPTLQGRFIARLRRSEEPKTSIIQLAQDALAENQYDKSEEILIPHLMKHPKDTKAYMVLGQIALQRQDYQEASQIFEQVIKLNPGEPDAQAGLGYAALQNGRYSIALRALQRAHEADSQNMQILEQLLNIARRLDNQILQKSVLEQLIELGHKQSEQFAKDLAKILDQEKIRA